MKVLLCLILLAGAFLMFSPIKHSAEKTALWSDFKAFEAEVARDEAGKRILSYGGENGKDNFELLLDRLWRLGSSETPFWLGLFIVLLSATGLVIEMRKPAKAEQSGSCDTLSPSAPRKVEPVIAEPAGPDQPATRSSGKPHDSSNLNACVAGPPPVAVGRP